MNTIGKILVILNFLFAVIVGLLIVLTAASRTKEKQKYDEQNKQNIVIVEGHKTNSHAISRVAGDYSKEKKKYEKAIQDLKDKEVELDLKQSEFDRMKQDYTEQLRAKDTTVEAIKSAKERLTKEFDFLSGVIKERENSIVELEAEVKKFRIIAQNQEANYQTSRIRTENLLEEVRVLARELAKHRAGVGATDTAVIRNPNAPNPPSVVVNGKIEIVRGGDLVQINQGSDHGLEKDHTLDVYRLSPDAKYLGMIRIIDANTHASVGRIVATGNVALRSQLKVGDLVTSKLTSR